MKGIDLLYAMNDIDDSFVDEASVNEKNTTWVKIGVQRVLPIAAVVLLGFWFIRPFMFSVKNEATMAGATYEESAMATEDMSTVMYMVTVKVKEPSDSGYFGVVIDGDEFEEGAVVELVTDLQLSGIVSVEFSEYDRDLNRIYVMDVVNLE